MRLEDCKDSWALVTGASSGIGREFAVQLAAAGVNLVLVARRGERLMMLSEELTQRHGVFVRVVPLDLAATDAVATLHSQLAEEQIRIRLLCNNAAFGRWGPFDATPLADYLAMVQLNVSAMIALCHQFRDDLSSHPTSAIINVSSPAALQPVPYMAVYAATKAFVHSFSQALYGELEARGILVQTLVPGPTATEFDSVAGAYESALVSRDRPSDVVSRSLSRLATNDPVVNAAKGTKTQRLFAALAPPRFVIKKVAKMFQPPKLH